MDVTVRDCTHDRPSYLIPSGEMNDTPVPHTSWQGLTLPSTFLPRPSGADVDGRPSPAMTMSGKSCRQSVNHCGA